MPPQDCAIEARYSIFQAPHHAYGCLRGPSPKATNLYADVSYANKLVRTPTAADKARFDVEDREIMTRDPITGAMTGGRDMKESQAYPEGYGLAVAAAYNTCVDTVAEEVADSECSSDEDSLVETRQLGRCWPSRSL